MIKIEATLYRDMAPRSRPSMLLLPIEINGQVTGKLFPGSASDGEHLIGIITYAAKVSPLWIAVRAQFIIDGVIYSDPHPGILYTGASDVPSCWIHYLPMAPADSPLFGGVHTLALRRI